MRSARSALRGQIKSGAVRLNDVLEAAREDDVAGGLKIGAAIESLPGMGRSRVQKLLEPLGIDASRRLRSLGARQRTALQEALSAS